MIEGPPTLESREVFIERFKELLGQGKVGFTYYASAPSRFEVDGNVFTTKDKLSGFDTIVERNIRENIPVEVEEGRGIRPVCRSSEVFDSGINEHVWGRRMASEVYETESEVMETPGKFFGRKKKTVTRRVLVGEKVYKTSEFVTSGTEEPAMVIKHALKLGKDYSRRPGNYAVHTFVVPESLYNEMVPKLRSDPRYLSQLVASIESRLAKYFEESKYVNGKIFIELKEFSSAPVNMSVGRFNPELNKDRIINYTHQ